MEYELQRLCAVDLQKHLFTFLPQGDQAVNLADELPSQLRFELDPAYYVYKGCECLGVRTVSPLILNLLPNILCSTLFVQLPQGLQPSRYKVLEKCCCCETYTGFKLALQ